MTGPYSFIHPHGRIYSSSAMISSDELLIFGGCLSGSFSGGPCPSSDSWVFSTKQKQWKKVDSSCISARKHSSMASVVSDGYRKSAVLFSGQENDKTILKTVPELEDEIALYDNLANRWILKNVDVKSIKHKIFIFFCIFISKFNRVIIFQKREMVMLCVQEN